MTIRNELLEEILAATGGGGGTTDNTTEGFIPVKQSGAFNNSAVSEDAININVTKPIIAPSITVDPGTADIGSQSLKAAGENFTTTNKADNDTFYPVWIMDGENIPSGRVTLGIEQELTQEASKADILINPSWQSNPIVDWRVVKLTFEVDTTITNVIFKVDKNGEKFYQAEIGTLNANTQTTIDLRTEVNTTFADAFVGDVYTASLSSVDGDVRAKGSTANALPYFKIGYFYFVDNRIADVNAQDFGQLENPMAFMSSDPIGLAIRTGVERNGEGQNIDAFNNGENVYLIVVTNDNQATEINSITFEHTGLWQGNIITLTTSQGTTTTVVTMVNGTNVVQFDQSVIALANESFTILVDGTNGSSNGSPQTELRLHGGLFPDFRPFFQLRVTDVRLSQIDPDLRTQSRTIAVGYEKQGYQAQIGGGIKENQGWTDNSTGSAFYSPQIDPIDGIITLESRDNTTGGLTSMFRPVTVSSLQDLFDFGGQITFLIRSLDGDASFSAGVGFSDADDPGWKVSGRGRFLIFFGIEPGGAQSFTPEGGTKSITPVINDYIEVIIVVAPGTMVADVYVNGVFDQTNDFSVSGSHANYDNKYLCGSGTTSGTNRNANMRTTEVTTFTTSAVLPFTKAQIELNLVGALPFGVFRDWTIQIPDEDVEFGSSSQTQLSNYGSVTLQRIGNNATFNGQDEMTITGPGSFIISQVNVDPSSPDQRYEVSFQGAAQQSATVFGSSDVALPSYQRLERLALAKTLVDNSEDVTLNPDSVTNDTIQLVGQRIQVFPVTPTKDGAMLQGDKAKLDTLHAGGGTVERLSTVMSADLVLSGSEQQIAFDPAQTSRSEGFTVNPGGSFTLDNDGFYNGDMSIYVDKSGGAGVFMAIWIECKPLLTGVWKLASVGMSHPTVFDDGGLPVAMSGSIDGLAGDEFRVMIKKLSGTATLKSIDEVVSLGTVTQFAASLSVCKAGPVTP